MLSADYVADLCVYEEKHCLLSVAGDGTLAVIDLREHKVLWEPMQRRELSLCMCLWLCWEAVWCVVDSRDGIIMHGFCFADNIET